MGKKEKIPRLQDALMLTDKGYQDLKKAVRACVLTNFSLMIPIIVMVQVIVELIKPYQGQEISWMNLWLLFGAGLVGLLVVFACYKNDYRKTYAVSYQEGQKTRLRAAEHIRRLPMSVFNSKNLSELTTNLMGDVAVTEHVLSHIWPQLLANAITIPVVCILLAIFDWRMALAIFISVPVAFLIIVLSRGIQNKLGRKHNKAKLAASEQVQEYLEGLKVIKACNLDGEQFEALEHALRTMKQLSIRFEFISGVFITGAQVVLQVGIGLTVVVGVTLLSSGSIELVPMLLCLLIVTRIYTPIQVELTLLPELLYNQIAAKRMRTLMNYQPMEGAETPLDHYDVSFERVSFSYNKEREETIKEITTDIPANSITALVGLSGSGKSTISRLIARFWDVDRGCLKIGGIEIKSLDPEHLMSYMSFVFQDVVLFDDTVYNNIRIGNTDATREEIMAAARAASCDEFVEKLPEGYETLLGENGATLSGGERQRLSIARALLKDAPIVLLDEATASLDPESESSIQQAISTLIEGKTVVVIAHRMRTIAQADKIIVLENGAIEEEGSHESLMEKDGLYAKLWNIQQENFGWSV